MVCPVSSRRDEKLNGCASWSILCVGDGWAVHCLASDCQTLVSQWSPSAPRKTLLRLLKASGGSPAEMEEIECDMKQQGLGSTFIEVNETGRRLLRILPQP